MNCTTQYPLEETFLLSTILEEIAYSKERNLNNNVMLQPVHLSILSWSSFNYHQSLQRILAEPGIKPLTSAPVLMQVLYATD